MSGSAASSPTALPGSPATRATAASRLGSKHLTCIAVRLAGWWWHSKRSRREPSTGHPSVGPDERPRIASVSLCAFGVVMYISVAARQRARPHEDDVDDEVYSVSGHEQCKPLAGVGRGGAHPVRGAARARTVCLHHQLLHPQPEPIGADAAGMAGCRGRAVLSDPL